MAKKKIGDYISEWMAEFGPENGYELSRCEFVKEAGTWYLRLFIDREGGLFEPSMVLLEQIRTIDKTRVEGYIGKLSRSSMEEIDDILLKSLGIVIPAEMEAP